MTQQQAATIELANKNGQQQTNNGDEIDLARLFGVLLDKKWIIVAVTAIAMLIGAFVALVSTPIYKADALLQVEEKSSGMPGIGEMGELFTQESSASTEIEVIRSRYVLGATVDALNLDIQVEPKLLPIIGGYFYRKHKSNMPAKPLLSSSFALGGEKIYVNSFTVGRQLVEQELTLVKGNGSEYSLWMDEIKLLDGRVGILEVNAQYDIEILISDFVARPETEFSLTKISRLKAIQNIQQNLVISEKGKKTGILSFSMTGPKPAQIEAILDSISEIYFLQNISRQSAEAEKSLEFLEDQLPEVKNKLTIAEEALNSYKLKRESVDLTLETKSALENMVSIETKLNELSIAEADIARRFTKNHPNYVSFQKQKSELEKRKRQVTQEANDLPETQQELLRLVREVEVNQQIYVSLLNNIQELSIVKAGTVGNVRILDKAAVYDEPVKPKKALIVVMTTMLGGILVVAYVLILSTINRGIENPEELENIGIPVYASVPLSKDYARKGAMIRSRKLSKNIDGSLILAISNPADLAIESLRSLRTSLHFAMLEAKNNVLMITGPSPEVGKSFISSNLAALIAQSEQRVLLIDGDLRKGFMQRTFKQNFDNGCSEVLSGKISLEQAIKTTEVEGLDLLPRGAVPPNPSELLMHANFKKMIDTVSEQYDLVIIDTPPILAVTDAAIVGAIAGGTLVVTRYARNPLKEVEITVKRLEQNGVQVKGTVFNAVERKNSSYYGSYGYYQYSYESDKPK